MSVRINVDFPTFLAPQTKMTAQPSMSPKNETYIHLVSTSFLRWSPDFCWCIIQPPFVWTIAPFHTGAKCTSSRKCLWMRAVSNDAYLCRRWPPCWEHLGSSSTYWVPQRCWRVESLPSHWVECQKPLIWVHPKQEWRQISSPWPLGLVSWPFHYSDSDTTYHRGAEQFTEIRETGQKPRQPTLHGLQQDDGRGRRHLFE